MQLSNILEPMQFVISHAKHVQINQSAINKYISNFHPTKINHWLASCPFKYRALPNNDDEIDRRFIQDALAFCFWGYPTKWTVEYEGQTLDGWWALLASIKRALDAGIPLLDGSYLSQLTLTTTRDIFAGKPEIPLLKERHQILNAIGRTLVADYNGHFYNYLSSAPHDAWELVTDLATKFPTFADSSLYQGKVIPFYKKAQLLVDELGDNLGYPITGDEKLTGKADYKIPALLRKLGILEYSTELAQLVDSRTPLAPDSDYEIEIRASMLYANHLICAGLNTKGIGITPMQLDGILWVASQTKLESDKPYHLTLTTAY